MKLEDWSVVKYHDKAYDVCVYGSVEDYADEIEKGIASVVPKEDWTISNMVTISESLLEDINHHRTEGMPSFIVDVMRKSNIDESVILTFMRTYMKELFDHYGY